jgi:hypothetical protein
MIRLSARRLLPTNRTLFSPIRYYTTTITTTTSTTPADEEDDSLRAGIPTVTTTITIENESISAGKTTTTTTIEPLFAKADDIQEGVAPVKVTTEIVTEKFEPMVMQDFDFNGTKFPSAM